MSFLPKKNNLSFSWLAPSLFCFYPQKSASRYQNVLQVKKHVIYCVSVIWNRWDQCSILLLCYESAPAQPAWKCLYSIWPSSPCEHGKTSVFFALLEVLNLSIVSASYKQARETPEENHRQQFLQSWWFFNLCSQSLQNWVTFSDPTSLTS